MCLILKDVSTTHWRLKSPQLLSCISTHPAIVNKGDPFYSYGFPFNPNFNPNTNDRGFLHRLIAISTFCLGNDLVKQHPDVMSFKTARTYRSNIFCPNWNIFMSKAAFQVVLSGYHIRPGFFVLLWPAVNDQDIPVKPENNNAIVIENTASTHSSPNPITNLNNSPILEKLSSHFGYSVAVTRLI